MPYIVDYFGHFGTMGGFFRTPGTPPGYGPDICVIDEFMTVGVHNQIYHPAGGHSPLFQVCMFSDCHEDKGLNSTFNHEKRV